MKAVTLPKAQYLSRQGSGFVVFRPHSSYSAASRYLRTKLSTSKQTSLTFLEGSIYTNGIRSQKTILIMALGT